MTMRIVPIRFSHDYDEQNKFKMRQSHHVLRYANTELMIFLNLSTQNIIETKKESSR